MGAHSISRRLTSLCTTLSVVSQIDPLVKAEMELIPEGMRIEFLIPLPASLSSFIFMKQDYSFVPIREPENKPSIVTFQILTVKTAQQLFAGRENLLYAISKEDITVKGPSSITLAIVRTLQLSFPYTVGLRKTRVLVPSFTRPINLRHRQITYYFLKIFMNKKRHPVEKIT